MADLKSIKQSIGKIIGGKMGDKINTKHSVERWGCQIDKDAMAKNQPTRAVCYHRFYNPNDKTDFIEVARVERVVNPTNGRALNTIKEYAREPEELDRLRKMTDAAFSVKAMKPDIGPEEEEFVE